MKWNTKANQQVINKGLSTNTKMIEAFFVDVKNKKIVEVRIAEYIEAIQKGLDFHEYEVFVLSKEKDSIIIGVDQDQIGSDNYFSLVTPNDEISKRKFYSNALVARCPAGAYHTDGFRNPKIKIEEVKKIIQFN